MDAMTHRSMGLERHRPGAP